MVQSCYKRYETPCTYLAHRPSQCYLKNHVTLSFMETYNEHKVYTTDGFCNRMNRNISVVIIKTHLRIILITTCRRLYLHKLHLLYRVPSVEIRKHQFKAFNLHRRDSGDSISATFRSTMFLLYNTSLIFPLFYQSSYLMPLKRNVLHISFISSRYTLLTIR